jgi:hypothetical protein
MMHTMHTMFTTFTISMMHIMFRWGLDAILLAVLISNILVGRKSRRLVKKLQKYYDNRAPVLINAMENMASAICPFCAAAAGLAKLGDEEQEEITVEPELEGEHRLCHGERGYASAPCPAAEIRGEARKLFAETMMEKTAA